MSSAPAADARHGHIDEMLLGARDAVLRRSPGEPEFQQAFHEVIASLGPVVAKRPEYVRGKLMERIAEPGARSSSASRGPMTAARSMSIVASASSSTARWAHTGAGCAFIRQ